jgi:hypothetical protein
MKTKFRFPNTQFCFVLWYRNNTPHETRIPTPPNGERLQSEMLKHKVGLSEIRAVKSDPSSPLRDMGELNADALARAMSSLS